MFLIPFEAHLLVLPPPKQGAAGNKCFSLVDKSLISSLSKQSVVDKDCFSLADDSFAFPPLKQCAAGNKCFSLADK